MKAKNRRIAYFGATGGVVLAIMTAATIAMNWQASNLDLVLGRGAKHQSESAERTGNYINFTYTSQEEALKNAQKQTLRTAEEGMTLLKNKNNALPLAGNEGVTVLGYYSWHNNMSGGEDPATTAGAVSLAKGIENGFGEKFNGATRDLYANASGDFDNPEVALASAEGTFASFPTAVITFKRNSGEGNDQVLNAGASEQSRIGLVINNAELKLVDYACKHFSKVIVVINSAHVVEVGELDDEKTKDNLGVDAIIWMGHTGTTGLAYFGEVISGEQQRHRCMVHHRR